MAEIRSWSATGHGVTSEAMTVFGELVIITSSSAVLFVVTLVGVVTIWDSLEVATIFLSLLLVHE